MAPSHDDTQGVAPQGRHDPYAAFRVRNYRLYVVGWFIALVGTRIQSVAIGWEMYQRTGEALSLGMVGLAQALPTMLLALPAGYLADRFDRPRLVMLSLLAMTGTSLALAVLSYREGDIILMYTLLVLDAAVVILGRPARVALVPQLMPASVFPNAVTWNTSLMQIASVLGPAIGGFVIAINVPLAYVLTAASSLVFIVVLSRLHFPAGGGRASSASWQTLVAGIHFVRDTPIILAVISLDLFAVLLGGAVYLLPIFAEDILAVGATGFGWLRAAPALGAFCMAILMVYLPPMRRAGRGLLLAVAGFGAATIVFGLSRSFWLSFAMLFLTGAFDNVSMIIRHTLQQLVTPDSMRGRVSAVSSIFVGASNELGGLESGLVAHWFGPVISVVSGGIGTLAVVGFTALISPQVRNFGALNDARPAGEEPEVPERKVAPLGKLGGN
jgi:MFS family permease